MDWFQLDRWLPAGIYFYNADHDCYRPCIQGTSLISKANIFT